LLLTVLLGFYNLAWNPHEYLGLTALLVFFLQSRLESARLLGFDGFAWLLQSRLKPARLLGSNGFAWVLHECLVAAELLAFKEQMPFSGSAISLGIGTFAWL
jgi:hypothetical protein